MSQPETPHRQSLRGVPALHTKEILEAQGAGRDAAVTGAPSTACPWRGSSDRDTGLRSMWLRGYAMGVTEVRQARAGNPPLTE